MVSHDAPEYTGNGDKPRRRAGEKPAVAARSGLCSKLRRSHCAPSERGVRRYRASYVTT